MQEEVHPSFEDVCANIQVLHKFLLVNLLHGLILRGSSAVLKTEKKKSGMSLLTLLSRERSRDNVGMIFMPSVSLRYLANASSRPILSVLAASRIASLTT